MVVSVNVEKMSIIYTFQLLICSSFRLVVCTGAVPKWCDDAAAPAPCIACLPLASLTCNHRCLDPLQSLSPRWAGGGHPEGPSRELARKVGPAGCCCPWLTQGLGRSQSCSCHAVIAHWQEQPWDFSWPQVSQGQQWQWVGSLTPYTSPEAKPTGKGKGEWQGSGGTAKHQRGEGAQSTERDREMEKKVCSSCCCGIVCPEGQRVYAAIPAVLVASPIPLSLKSYCQYCPWLQ